MGQRLVLDLRLEVGECDATVTDRVEDTVDYGQVCDTANLVAQQRSYRTLERLCAAIADRLLEQYSAPVGVGQGGQARAAARAAGRARSRSSCGARRSPVDDTPAVGYLGLGSNIGDRAAYLAAALERPARARGGGRGVLLAL